MNASGSVRVAYEELRTLNSGAFAVGYMGVGAPFTNPIRLLKVTNTSDANLIVSFDGVTDHDFVAANGFYLYDYGSNASGRSGFLEQPAGNRLYVRLEGAAATGGDVYVTTIYVSQV